jgi:DNA-binding MarR family transcriptional regulator
MAKPSEGPTGDPVTFEFFNEIGIIGQLSQNRLEQALPGGLKLPHFTVLNHFTRLGGERSPAELARAFQVTKGAMTNTIQRLEARGLIAVRPDPSDGRAKKVSLTDAGRAARDDAVAAIAPIVEQLNSRFTDSQFEEALPFLREVRVYLDEARDRPPP